MSVVIGNRRRRVVMPLRRSVGAPWIEPTRERFPRLFSWTVLVTTLPLFAQSFYYLNELPPPYFLSKAWPVLVFPLTLYAITRMALPAKHIYVVFLTYAIGFTPMISMIQLGNAFTDALTTTVKVWPITYYFALSAMLYWLAPPTERLRLVVLSLGAGTFILMIVLWILAPTSWYVNNPNEGKLLLYELERGYRIYMPLFFGMIFLFYCIRSFTHRPHWLYAAAMVAIFIILFAIYKQRAAIGAAVLVCGFGVLASLPRIPRRLLIGVGVGLLPVVVALVAWKLGGDAKESLGGSLSVRQNSFAIATGFLGDNPWRWVIGVGGTTRFGAVTLQDIFGDNQFYIADLGWVGVVFEYGLVGATLLAALYGWGYWVTLRAAARLKTRFSEALSDYVLYMIVSSSVYSLVFTPGELGVVMAIAVYMDHERERRARLADTRALQPAPPDGRPLMN